jgi:hypothetical protein
MIVRRASGLIRGVAWRELWLGMAIGEAVGLLILVLWAIYIQ